MEIDIYDEIAGLFSDNPLENISDKAGNYSNEWKTLNCINSVFTSISSLSSSYSEIASTIQEKVSQVKAGENIQVPDIVTDSQDNIPGDSVSRFIDSVIPEGNEFAKEAASKIDSRVMKIADVVSQALEVRKNNGNNFVGEKEFDVDGKTYIIKDERNEDYSILDDKGVEIYSYYGTYGCVNDDKGESIGYVTINGRDVDISDNNGNSYFVRYDENNGWIRQENLRTPDMEKGYNASQWNAGIAKVYNKNYYDNGGNIYKHESLSIDPGSETYTWQIEDENGEKTKYVNYNPWEKEDK